MLEGFTILLGMRLRSGSRVLRNDCSVNIAFVLDLECQGPLGMASGAITDAQISASSQRNANYAARQGRLHSNAIWIAGAWSAGKNDSDQWLQIDLNGQYKITRVATQGRNAAKYDWWVTKYKLQYSNNTTRFQYYKEPGQEEFKVKLIIY